ncbi:hypothetical protein EDB19DRAFT_1627087, partial [Suillus lakei]
SKNCDMDLALSYNTELFPLTNGDNFAIARRRCAHCRWGRWRPDGNLKERRGLEEYHNYVMYDKGCAMARNHPRGLFTHWSQRSIRVDRCCYPAYRHLTNVVLGDPVYVLLRQ